MLFIINLPLSVKAYTRLVVSILLGAVVQPSHKIGNHTGHHLTIDWLLFVYLIASFSSSNVRIS